MAIRGTPQLPVRHHYRRGIYEYGFRLGDRNQSAKKSRLPEGRRLKISGSGHDAPMLAGEVGVARNRSRRREVQIALEWKPERAACRFELFQAHVAEFAFGEAEIAKTESQILVRVELCGVPSNASRRHREF